MTFDETICELLYKHLKIKSFDNIFTFLPNKNEPDILPIIKIFLKSKSIFVPVYRNKKWSITKLNRFENLKTNEFNILQPETVAEVFYTIKDTNFSKKDICLIPGILFSKNGGRIGHGGGIYDQYLKYTPTYNIGITYEKKLIQKLPQRIEDLKINAIITEKEIYKTGRL